MTHTPVCKSASCHWEEQLSVCSFQAVSLQQGTDWVVVSVLGSCDSPLLFQTRECCSCSGHWWFLGSLGPHAIHRNTSRGFWDVRRAPLLALSGRVLSPAEASSEFAELDDLLSTQEVLLQRDSFHKQLS